ncbi:MAG: hypothetical protein RIS36_2119 [Pseudomonadota bacterium]
MSVGEEHRVNTADLVLKRLVTKIGTRVDQDNPSVIEGEARGGSISVISWVLRCAYLTRTPGEGNSRRGA